MKTNTISSKLLVGLLGAAGALVAIEAQAQNTIDLSHWKLTLPVGASETAAGQPMEISAAQLSAGYTNAEYFHRGADGQLVFWCPVTGARTENTDYSRCELREVVNPADDNVCWSARGTHTMDASCRVMEVPSGQKVVIGQIHGYSGKASPLIKLQFFKGRIEALVKDKARKGRDIKLTFPEVGLNKDFDYQIKLHDGVLSITVNGTTQSENVFKLDPSWAAQTLYFKAGVYPQDNEGPATEGARVSFSKLKVSHTDAASPASGNPAK
jgi:hypothetical protein